MTDNETQDKINQAEWGNPDSWSTIYFSKKDSRTWVPKRNPKQGWTINFGNPSGAKWVYYLLMIFFLIGCTLGVLILFLLVN